MNARLLAAHPEVFASPDLFQQWYILGMIDCALVGAVIGFIGMLSFPEKRIRGFVLLWLGAAVFIISVTLTMGAMLKVNAEATNANTEVVRSAMERSVADTYKLELIETPLLMQSLEDRKNPALSTFRTEGGQEIEFLLAFEKDTGRAILTDAAGGRLTAITR